MAIWHSLVAEGDSGWEFNTCRQEVEKHLPLTIAYETDAQDKRFSHLKKAERNKFLSKYMSIYLLNIVLGVKRGKISGS